jgi:hypothetical protein
MRDAQSFCKITEWWRGRVGQEVARGSVLGARAGGSSVTGGDLRLDRLVGSVGLGDGPLVHQPR